MFWLDQALKKDVNEEKEESLAHEVRILPSSVFYMIPPEVTETVKVTQLVSHFDNFPYIIIFVLNKKLNKNINKVRHFLITITRREKSELIHRVRETQTI